MKPRTECPDAGEGVREKVSKDLFRHLVSYESSAPLPGEQYVRELYPKEVETHRRRANAQGCQQLKRTF